MPVRIVQSKQNPRLKELRRALIAPGRESGGGPALAGIEGPNLISEALRALTMNCQSIGEDLLISARLREW